MLGTQPGASGGWPSGLSVSSRAPAQPCHAPASGRSLVPGAARASPARASPLASHASGFTLQPSPAVPHGRFQSVFTSQDCVLLLLPVLWAVSRVLSSRVSILLELPSESEGTFWFVPSCCRTVVPMTPPQCLARPCARVYTAMVPALKLSVR